MVLDAVAGEHGRDGVVEGWRSRSQVSVRDGGNARRGKTKKGADRSVGTKYAEAAVSGSAMVAAGGRGTMRCDAMSLWVGED